MPQDVTGWWAERPAPIIASLRKITASLFASQIARADLASTLKVAASAITGAHKQTGTIVAAMKHPLATLTGPMNATGTIVATGKKTAAVAAGGVTKTGTITATAKKNTASLTGGTIRTGTIAATAKKATASASGAVFLSGTIAATAKKTVAAFNALTARYFDDFTRADSTTSAGPNWTNTINHMGITSNTAYPVDAGVYSTAKWSSAMATDSHKISCVVTEIGGGGAGGPLNLYVASGTDIQCHARFTTASVLIRTTTDWGDLGTTKASENTVGCAQGDTISFERSGTTFVARINNTSVLTWNDTAPVMPKDSSHRLVAIGGFGGGGRLDNFMANDI